MFDLNRVLSFDYPRQELAVIGWSCLDDFQPVDELWAAVDGKQVPCLTGLARADVARNSTVSTLGNCGFLCRFPVSGTVTAVTLIARHAGEMHIVGRFAAEWAPWAARPESGVNDYGTWLRTHEPRLFWSASEVNLRLRHLAHSPVISVILPTFNTEPYYLHRCIESVTSQLYPHWELCITDDASSDPRIRPFLLERAAAEPRIRLSWSERNGGISAASNRSIAASTGDFMVLLDHDDELHPSALLEVARCLSSHPDSDLIYSDEDKIDQAGVRAYPAFKPEFDEDLMCGFDYLGHLVAMRSSLVRQVGGFRSESDGAQDWDLLLRVISATTRDRVRHIPKPLYHWRMHEDSTSVSLDAKPYAVRAWNGVLERHLQSPDSCRVEGGLFRGSMRIVRRLPGDTRIAILARACDGPHQRRALNRCKAARQATFFEIVLSSVHPADHPDTSALMCAADLESDVTIVVNCRIDSVNHHFLEELAAQALREDCGVVASTVLRADGTVLTAGLECLSDGTYVNPFEGLAPEDAGYMGQARVVRQVSSIGPQIFAFRTSRLLDVNGLACIGEDSLHDVCASLVRSAHAMGLKVLHTPYAVATLRSPVTTYTPRQGEEPPHRLMVNRNLESFPSVTAILKAGIR